MKAIEVVVAESAEYVQPCPIWCPTHAASTPHSTPSYPMLSMRLNQHGTNMNQHNQPLHQHSLSSFNKDFLKCKEKWKLSQCGQQWGEILEKSRKFKFLSLILDTAGGEQWDSGVMVSADNGDSGVRWEVASLSQDTGNIKDCVHRILRKCLHFVL